MDKRERLERTIAGEATDRPPVALWRAFPGDDQRAADLAEAVIEFQKRYDWDFINVVPAYNYLILDHGMQDEWQGAVDGSRVSVKTPIKRSLDWTELRAMNPERGELGKMLICIRQIAQALPETPIMVTIHSPLVQASRLASEPVFIRHLRRNGDRVRTGLNLLTETTLNFVEAIRGLGVAGVCYIIAHANYDVFAESEYDVAGLPYDRRILESLPGNFWLNMVHLAGHSPMLRFVSSYQTHLLSWENQVQDAAQSLAQARTLFAGGICGGLDSEAHLRQGTPTMIGNTAREVFQQVNQRRLILSAGGAIPVTTPLSNLRAVRSAAEGMRV